MQTFLPYENFLESAKVLDKKRCWKQVVEANQIIEAFYLPKFPGDKGFNNGKYFWPLMDGSNTFKII